MSRALVTQTLRRAAVRFRCMMGGHDWTGQQVQPMAYIRCRRCGWMP